MTYELAIIGGGNMGSALLAGLLGGGGPTDAAEIVVIEPSAARREALAAEFPKVAVEAEPVSCRSALIAVKPQYVGEVVGQVVAAGARRILSIAAGVTTEAIAAAAGGADSAGASVSVVRAMPNTPALVGEGVSALAGAPGTPPADLDWAEQVLSGVGLVVRVAEYQLDAVTGLTGSGPAYVFLVAEALIDAGVLAGLPRALVEQMVTRLLVGSSALLAERGDPAQLRAMVTSPGGTTAAGLRALEQHAVRAAFLDAVQASAARSLELGA
ncbi:MAG TPA: pyrroline-5-carboxylate reductase [Ilumatobacter sp.]|nr:pyrroline-5-carboxylate reductase [Ilumatobacter sp.]